MSKFSVVFFFFREMPPHVFKLKNNGLNNRDFNIDQNKMRIFSIIKQFS